MTANTTRRAQKVAEDWFHVKNGWLFISISRGQSIFMTSEEIDFYV